MEAEFVVCQPCEWGVNVISYSSQAAESQLSTFLFILSHTVYGVCRLLNMWVMMLWWGQLHARLSSAVISDSLSSCNQIHEQEVHYFFFFRQLCLKVSQGFDLRQGVQQQTNIVIKMYARKLFIFNNASAQIFRAADTVFGLWGHLHRHKENTQMPQRKAAVSC